MNIGKLFKQESILLKSQLNIDRDDGYFCSELIGKVLKYCKLLDPVKSCCQYWPIDFSSKRNLHLLDGARLGDEKRILLN